MKFAPFVVITAMFGAMVGWFAPGGPGPASGSHGAPVAAKQTRLDVAQRSAWNAGEVVLERAGDGHSTPTSRSKAAPRTCLSTPVRASSR